jgi:hypothetical protein
MKKYKKNKKFDFFFKNLIFFEKTENELTRRPYLTRRHFLAVGLAYADGKS